MSARRRTSGPGWRAVLRDLSTLTLPWIVIFKQAGIGFDPPAQPSIFLLLLMGSILSVPGAAQVLSRFGGGTGMAEPPPLAVSAPSRHGPSPYTEPSAGDA